MDSRFLSARFKNGGDNLDSRIVLRGDWLGGWKFKDNKWKFEEETELHHVGDAWFRCRVHLFAPNGRLGESREPLEKKVDAINASFDLWGVELNFNRREFTVVAGLSLGWEITDNESKNPMLLRGSGQGALRLAPGLMFDYQILITYRNLDKLKTWDRMFAERQDGFDWVGSQLKGN